MSGRCLLEKRLGRGRPLRLFLAILLGLQALFATSHFHSSHYFPPDPTGSEVSSSRSSGERPVTDDSADCSICHLLSLMGDALLLSGIALSLSGTLIWWSISATWLGQAHCARSRGWRSRAPPVLS